jgi:carbamoyl-phosphate synthase large subunit
MKLTVLISSAGRRVELINCFRDDARALGVDLRVLAADCEPVLSAACQLADESFAVPRCDRDEFVPRLFELCLREGVDLLVPTIDPELAPLARARGTFAAIGTRVVVSSAETVALARDKLQTAAFLARAGLPAPASVPLAELLARGDALKFPVILKRIDGSSSIGLHEADDLDAVRRLELEPARYLAQEKWVGREYTVNVFFDRAGRLRAAVPHWRCATRAGEVSKGRTERVPLLLELAERLGAVLPGAEGPLCFQSIVTAGGDAMIFELNARFGGGFPLAHRAGARFSRWLLEEAAGRPCSADDEWQEGLTMLRYDAAVFLSGEESA